eukprot:scaffold33152_cov143-Isochrysis_galbana.AAC.3
MFDAGALRPSSSLCGGSCVDSCGVHPGIRAPSSGPCNSLGSRATRAPAAWPWPDRRLPHRARSARTRRTAPAAAPLPGAPPRPRRPPGSRAPE